MKLSPSQRPFPLAVLSLAVVAALSLPLPAAAQSIHPTAAAASAKSAGMASQSSRVEARIGELRTKLRITAEQEDKWNALTQVMRDNARQLDALRQARMQSANQMTAVEDVKSYSQIADAHAEGLKKFIPAFESLYGSMSEAQKKQADALFHRGHARVAGKTASAKTRS